MKLFLSIIFSTVLSIVLFAFQPFLAAVILSGIAIGALLRGVYLLHAIHDHLIPKEDKVQAAVRRYHEEQQNLN